MVKWGSYLNITLNLSIISQWESELHTHITVQLFSTPLSAPVASAKARYPEEVHDPEAKKTRGGKTVFLEQKLGMGDY